MQKWIDECKTIRTNKTYIEVEKEFEIKFGPYLKNLTMHLFNTLIFQKYKKLQKNIIFKFSFEDLLKFFTFDELLILNGIDGANAYIKALENVKFNRYEFCQEATLYKEIIKQYQSGEFKTSTFKGFDKNKQLYFIEICYYFKNDIVIFYKNYYTCFNNFIKAAGFDLCSSNLIYAPIESEKIKKYKFDEDTLLPFDKSKLKYVVLKEYKDNKFIVTEKYINEDNKTIFSRINEFEYFFEFVAFLNDDLKDSNLLFCNGIENIKRLSNLEFDRVKVRSFVARELGLNINKPYYLERYTESVASLSEINIDNILSIKHYKNECYNCEISYVSDIHLEFRLQNYHCESKEDEEYVIEFLAKRICEDATDVNIIAGDTSSDINLFSLFVCCLNKYKHSKQNFFFTLGNHELWSFAGQKIECIVDQYKRFLSNYNMYLIHNNLYYLNERNSCYNQWIEITSKELSEISSEKLISISRDSFLMIFGGIGFSGKNNVFNANNGIYRDTVDRETEIKESDKFLKLYTKVISNIKDRNLIVVSHMPMEDWGNELNYENGVVYISGHNHKNKFFDDGKKRLYSDNQIGYKGNNVSLKRISINFDYDWFSSYGDGIYEITRCDYYKFYRGINEILNYDKDFKNLYLLKRDNIYLFLMRFNNGNLMILNGGGSRINYV